MAIGARKMVKYAGLEAVDARNLLHDVFFILEDKLDDFPLLLEDLPDGVLLISTPPFFRFCSQPELPVVAYPDLYPVQSSAGRPGSVWALG
jgi:hypothetical protein